jgi:tetraacyldisaccharide 4'-kinase
MSQPTRFFEMLVAAGLEIERLALPDHYDFAALPWPAQTPEVIVTEKDAVKLAPARTGSTRIWVAPLDFRTGPDFDAALLRLLPRPKGDTG